MNEEERAEWLARAVDNLIQRREAEPPKELNDRDLESLMRVAKIRLELGQATAHAGLQHEGAVWQKVLDRLESRAAATSRIPGAATFFLRRARDEAGPPDEDDQELRELQDVAALRRTMAAEMMALAETHREVVWDKVQSRLAARDSKPGFFSFLRRDREDAEKLARALDGIATGQTVWQSTDSRIDELVELARKRRVLGQMAQGASSKAQQRVWARISETADKGCALEIHGSTGRGAGWQRFALGAAALALVVAAIGPIPATGLAGHPAIGFVESVGEHVGVAESGGPPISDAPPKLIQGTPTTTAEASQQLGVTAMDPTVVPAGFQPSGSLYYANGVTSSGGVFLLSYTSASGSVLIFQEASTGAALAVEPGAAQDVTLADGTPATLVAGSWVPGASDFAWTPNAGRTLVFDRNGVRTMIQYAGDEATAPDLAAIADGLR